uniref:Uncharacterized protein n=1 Tax=Amphimedon queenslandica TaxID=400682 RepID=A0A1X7UK50_AMPQE
MAVFFMAETALKISAGTTQSLHCSSLHWRVS